jgi:two-component system LytT family sensor kinase
LITKNKNIVSVIAHTAAWVCFFTLPYLVFFPRMLDSQYNMSDHMFASIVCNNVFLVVFYYLNTQILIPKLLMQEKWFLYITAVISCLIIFLIIPKYLAGIISPPEVRTYQRPSLPNAPGRTWQGRKRPLVEPFNMAIFFMVFTVGTCVAVIQRWLKTEEHRKETESEKLNTELSFLKSQINPHFFFNTLNNIYSLAIVKSEKTAPAVMKLSSIMRYILTETNNNLVPLQNEVDFTKNYIELQQVRLTEKTTINFNVVGEVDNKNIAPLLFIAFVENAFKYGVSTKSNSEINILIESQNDKIIFTASNYIVQSENNMTENTGIGINNVKRRLELMYPNKHQLSNTIKDNNYLVHLEISI